jgi:hypothetical protein
MTTMNCRTVLALTVGAAVLIGSVPANADWHGEAAVGVGTNTTTAVDGGGQA